MITAYRLTALGLQPVDIVAENVDLLNDARWIDLLSPNKQEEKLVEKYLDLDIPTKKEMQEIEPSNRLYKEGNTLFMTATMVSQSDSSNPSTDAVTFILTDKRLITVRYIEPHSFSLFISRLSRTYKNETQAEQLLIGLLESTVDRLADILENITHNLDHYSQLIFRPGQSNGNSQERTDYTSLLQNIGANGDLGTKARDSLVSFNRLVYYLGQTFGSKFEAEFQLNMSIIKKDIDALSDHASFISTKVSFLLNATLGMVNIEQNNIIKIFSVAAVIFLPPTLIASIYGMNFSFMPELDWRLGYPIAIMLMLISAWLPYRYFKKRKWL